MSGNGLRIGFAISLLVFLIAGCSSDESGPAPEPLRYGAINGFVYLHSTPVPLSNAVVEIAGRSDTTLSSGKYFIDSIPHGTHTLAVTRDEYRDYSEEISVSDTSWLDISLRIDIDVGDLHGYVMHPAYGRVSSAKVFVDNDSALTNPDGFFVIPNVPAGEQVVTCSKTQDGYHDFSETIYIAGSDNEFNIVLVRTVHDSVRVVVDAYIEHNSKTPANNSLNFGSQAEIAMFHWQSADSVVKRRFLVVLPEMPSAVDLTDLESATLVFKETHRSNLSTDANWVPQTIVVRRIVQEWSEHLVTWNTAPRAESDPFTIFKSAENGINVLDVMEIYTHPEETPYGLRFAFREDEDDDPAVRRLEFYSREAYFPPYYQGPFVEFVYTH